MYTNSNDNMRTHVGASFDWSENDLAILIHRTVGVSALDLAQLPPGLVPLCQDPFRPEVVQVLQVVGDGVGSSSAAPGAAPVGGDVDYNDADDQVLIGLLGRQSSGKSKARGPDPKGKRKRSGFSPAPPPSPPHSGSAKRVVPSHGSGDPPASGSAATTVGGSTVGAAAAAGAALAVVATLAGAGASKTVDARGSPPPTVVGSWGISPASSPGDRPKKKRAISRVSWNYDAARSREHQHFPPKAGPMGGSASSSAGGAREEFGVVEPMGPRSSPAGSGPEPVRPDEGAHSEVGAPGAHQEHIGGPPPSADSGQVAPDAEVEAAANSGG
uniref:Uncharacterized protein n=1 Tax=Leersia perrieri TaxID=77586 RepID=A0A0D9V011_9ORYZ